MKIAPYLNKDQSKKMDIIKLTFKEQKDLSGIMTPDSF